MFKEKEHFYRQLQKVAKNVKIDKPDRTNEYLVKLLESYHRKSYKQEFRPFFVLACLESGHIYPYNGRVFVSSIMPSDDLEKRYVEYKIGAFVLEQKKKGSFKNLFIKSEKLFPNNRHMGGRILKRLCEQGNIEFWSEAHRLIKKSTTYLLTDPNYFLRCYDDFIEASGRNDPYFHIPINAT